MGKKKILAGCLCVGMLTLFSACGKSNGLFVGDTEREYEQLHIVAYEGGNGTDCYTEDAKAIGEIFQTLNRVSAKKAEEWSTSLVTDPIYAVIASYKEEESIIPEFFYGYWSNGYYITADGSVFHFSYDFDKLTDKSIFTGKTEDISIADMPMSGMLVSDTSGWKKEFLTGSAPANEVSGLAAQMVEFADKELTISYEHQGDVALEFGPEEYVLEVNLDGAWYELPPDRAWRTDIGHWHEINPGRQGTECFDLSVYGDLPKGKYRYVAEVENERVSIVEFEIP